MNRFYSFAVAFLCSITAIAQPSGRSNSAFIIDTTVVNGDSLVIFSDKSWEYLEVMNFDGVLYPELHAQVMADTNWQFTTHWHNDMCYETENNLAGMKDTLWTCVVDSAHQQFVMPIDGPVISTFKYRGRRFHYGIDLDLETGDTVVAAFDGRVRYAKYNSSGYGNLIIVRHYNGLETYYAHLSKINVSVNQEVKAGELIGLGGNTGRSTGSHLHFEVRFYDNALDPEEVIDFKNKTLKDENLFVHKGLFDYKKVSSSKPSGNSSVVRSDAKYHKVRSGDSLYKIARMYGTSIDRLCKLNNINRDDILKVGIVLKVK